MSRLPRPRIPFDVRLAVALRQLGRDADTIKMLVDIAKEQRSCGSELKIALAELLNREGGNKLELHHRPSLVNRPRKGDDYVPRANDPDGLVYLRDDDHDVETRIRGLHGQHSDLALARKNKRIARNRDPKRRKAKIKSGNRWPAKGIRKIFSRKKIVSVLNWHERIYILDKSSPVG